MKENARGKRQPIHTEENQRPGSRSCSHFRTHQSQERGQVPRHVEEDEPDGRHTPAKGRTQETGSRFLVDDGIPYERCPDHPDETTFVIRDRSNPVPCCAICGKEIPRFHALSFFSSGDRMRDYVCAFHPDTLVMADVFRIVAGEIPPPTCRACGSIMQRVPPGRNYGLSGGKYERGYPLADISTYWPDGSSRERIRDNVKRNSTRPLVPLGKRIEKELLKGIRS